MPYKPNLRKKLTRQEQRDLDVEINFVEGIVRRAPDYIEALQLLGDGYTKRGRLDEGLRIDERLAELQPDDPMTHYNLACSYSLTERYNSAFSALERALSLGYYDFKWLAKDPDLLNLRRHPLYKKIRDKVRSMQIVVS